MTRPDKASARATTRADFRRVIRESRERFSALPEDVRDRLRRGISMVDAPEPPHNPDSQCGCPKQGESP